MAIYYSLTFFLLAAEMVAFVLLLMPMPLKMRRSIFTFITTSTLVAKVAYALKISFIFIGVLFVDAVQRMLRITAESEAAKQQQGGVKDVRVETNFAARKFYAQRNTYLTGFCLFLSLVLARTISILGALVTAEEQLAALKAKTASGSKDQIQVDALKKRVAELEKVERNFETLKKQAKQQGLEYDRLTGELQKLSGSGDKRKD